MSPYAGMDSDICYLFYHCPFRGIDAGPLAYRDDCRCFKKRIPDRASDCTGARYSGTGPGCFNIGRTWAMDRETCHRRNLWNGRRGCPLWVRLHNDQGFTKDEPFCGTSKNKRSGCREAGAYRNSGEPRQPLLESLVGDHRDGVSGRGMEVWTCRGACVFFRSYPCRSPMVQRHLLCRQQRQVMDQHAVLSADDSILRPVFDLFRHLVSPLRVAVLAASLRTGPRQNSSRSWKRFTCRHPSARTQPENRWRRALFSDGENSGNGRPRD